MNERFTIKHFEVHPSVQSRDISLSEPWLLFLVSRMPFRAGLLALLRPHLSIGIDVMSNSVHATFAPEPEHRPDHRLRRTVTEALRAGTSYQPSFAMFDIGNVPDRSTKIAREREEQVSHVEPSRS